MPAITLPFSGLRLGWKRFESVETGQTIPIDAQLWRDFKGWLPYGVREYTRTLSRRDAIAVEGLPNLPFPYYLLWGVLRRAGLRKGRNPQVTIAFTDKTRVGDIGEAKAGLVLNGDCRDITKSRVAEVFEDVFGYALAVDPTTYAGPMVCKSEENGVHDGYIVQGPCAARPGWVYQRAVDNSDGDSVVDLRCPTVFGKLAVVCKKRRALARRFENYNASCELAEPGDVFNADELSKIEAFCKAMYLDWGGLDILRDRSDERLYIVDVNKTDMPVLILPTREKLEVSDRLARLLRTEIEARIK
jgi:hypothetical protein